MRTLYKIGFLLGFLSTFVPTFIWVGQVVNEQSREAWEDTGVIHYLDAHFLGGAWTYDFNLTTQHHGTIILQEGQFSNPFLWSCSQVNYAGIGGGAVVGVTKYVHCGYQLSFGGF